MSVVDARGLRCPLPVIELQRQAARSGSDELVTLLADDPASASDVPAWCRLRGHQFVGAEPAAGGGVAYVVRLRNSAGGGSSSAADSAAR